MPTGVPTGVACPSSSVPVISNGVVVRPSVVTNGNDGVVEVVGGRVVGAGVVAGGVVGGRTVGAGVVAGGAVGSGLNSNIMKHRLV